MDAEVDVMLGVSEVEELGRAVCGGLSEIGTDLRGSTGNEAVPTSGKLDVDAYRSRLE